MSDAGDLRECFLRSLSGAYASAAAVRVGTDGTHAPATGQHNHAHSAYGTQGGDSFHSHMHSHDNDAHHGHHGQADDLTEALIHGAAAAFAAQDKARTDRARTVRLNRLVAQGRQLRAAAEARYGDLDVLQERMMAGGARARMFYLWTG